MKTAVNDPSVEPRTHFDIRLPSVSYPYAGHTAPLVIRRVFGGEKASHCNSVINIFDEFIS